MDQSVETTALSEPGLGRALGSLSFGSRRSGGRVPELRDTSTGEQAHSERSASMGSTFVARLAGTYEATTATVARIAATAR